MRHILGLFIVLLLFSCNGDKNSEGNFDWELTETPILSNSFYHGVVNQAYVKLLAEIDTPENLINTCRQGDVLQVMQRKYDSSGEVLWLQVKFQDQNAWVEANKIQIFDNLEQAETAAKQMVLESN